MAWARPRCRSDYNSLVTLSEPEKPFEGAVRRPAIFHNELPLEAVLFDDAADFLFDPLQAVLAEPNDGNEGIGRGTCRSYRVQRHEVLGQWTDYPYARA